MALQVKTNSPFYTFLGMTLLMPPTLEFVLDQFAVKNFNWQKNTGDTMDLKRWPFPGDFGYTLNDRVVTETQIIGINNPVNMTADTITLQLQDIYGPWNSTTSAVAPYGITEKAATQAAQNLINYMKPLEFMNSIGGEWLKYDHDRLHDRVLIGTLESSPNVRNPGGKADNATLTTDIPTSADIIAMRKFLMESPRLARPFADGNFVCVIDSQVEANLLNDPDWKTATSRGAPERIWRGEIGTYMGVRFVKSENIPTIVVNTHVAHQFFMFGKEAIGYAQGKPSEIRSNKSDDYERFLYLIWKAQRAYATLNPSWIIKGRSFD